MSDEDVLQADEAERAVLGALLIDPSVLRELGSLTAADFFRPPHATIFAAVREAVDSGDRVDQLVVMNILREHGDLIRVGGAGYLHTLETSVPSVANASYYARLVAATAKRRRLLELAVRLRQACHTPDLDDSLEQAADLAVAILTEIDGVQAKAPDPTSEVVEIGAFTAESGAPYDWVVPGLIERMDRVIVVASEGAGKSTWARHVAITLGQGRHPLNPNLRIPPKRTLIVDLENPPANIRRKARHLVAAAEASGGWEADRCFLWSRPGGVNLRKPADQALLDRVIAHVRPALVCLGPLYKAGIGGGDRGEQVASETAGALDRVREKYGCALWLEHHAPMSQQGHRDLRPVESGVWSRWPEFGIALRRDGERNAHRFKVERFRGDRDERCWPDYLQWGRQWPFEAIWEDGMPGGLFDGNFEEAV
jgi:replicative DNA helicase